MTTVAAKRVTEALKRLGDDERAFVLAWLLRYYTDNGQMISPNAPRGQGRRTIVLDGSALLLVRELRRPGSTPEEPERL